MMNNKGFTLVELIATIALLSIIAIISFVSINGVIEQGKINDCENVVRSIKSASKEYVSDNRYSFTSNNALNINAEVLITGDYLSSPVVNPFTNDEIAASTIEIKIDLNSDYTAKNITIEAPLILKECKSE